MQLRLSPRLHTCYVVRSASHCERVQYARLVGELLPHRLCHAALQVLAQRIRWSEAYQAPTSSQPAHDSAEGSTSSAAISVSDLLEYRDPKTGLTPLMAAVVRGNVRVARQVGPVASSRTLQQAYCYSFVNSSDGIAQHEHC